jgi:hypothetical protein
MIEINIYDMGSNYLVSLYHPNHVYDRYEEFNLDYDDLGEWFNDYTDDIYAYRLKCDDDIKEVLNGFSV